MRQTNIIASRPLTHRKELERIVRRRTPNEEQSNPTEKPLRRKKGESFADDRSALATCLRAQG